jgi:hypothetical protein
VFSYRQGIFDEYRWIISRLQWLLDGIIVVVLLLLTCWACGESFRLIFQVLGLITFLLTIMVFRAAQLYQPWRGANLIRLVRRVFLGWLVIVAILMMLGYVTKTSVHFSRKVLLIWVAIVPVALVILRLQVFWGLRWLRRSSLDELPQFFNVLSGSMSIVGPRPHAVAHNEYYRRLIPGYMLRHKVRPGLTGWAQINGWRGETETLEKMEKRVEFDLEYLRRWSLWFDLKIIILTIFRGFKDSHAY